jgi:polyhydroxybutyrate depolymerase
LIGLVAAVAGTEASENCGGAPDGCRLPGGAYHAELPAQRTLAPPAVVFLHGWGSSGEGVLRDRATVEPLIARGYAVIAPDGTPREGLDGYGWRFWPDETDGRNEPAFLRAVADDAARRFGLDRNRMILSGFSVGGSMVSYTACADPLAFAAYTPVAGSFWQPYPESCAGPVRLLHTHGWIDGTVPLEGRRVGADGPTQGDVFAALAILRRTNGCPSDAPNVFRTDGGFMLRSWTHCAPSSGLDFVLHGGGHIVPPGWAELAIEWFEAP